MKTNNAPSYFSKSALTLLMTGALMIGAATGWVMAEQASPRLSTKQNADKQPLYWVAPMDASYRRDGPGKSPMGMDLIPVYEEKARGHDPAGTITIAPNVVQNLGVRTAQVSQGPLSQTLNTVGVIEFNPALQWQINLRVSGWVETLQVNRIGSRVQKGDPLFTLYSPQWVKAQQEYVDALRDGRRHLIKAAHSRLLALGIDAAHIAALKQRRQVSRSVAVRAPADGVVGELAIVEGAYVAPQQMLLRAGSLDTVWVQAEVFEQQGHFLKQGDPVTMRVPALPGQVWQGQVDYRYPVVDSKTRAQTLRLVFANPQQQLLPNMYADLEIRPANEPDVLRVPRQAVIEDGRMSRVVLALGEGQYRSVRIEKAAESQDWVAVKKGLTLGQQVVTSAQFLLDSESSKSADFSRMDGAPERQWLIGQVSAATDSPQQWIIRHAPVAAWQWPAMVMPFSVADGVDTQALKVGMPIRFAVEKSGQAYWIAEFDWDYRPQPSHTEATDSKSAPTYPDVKSGEIDHSGMDHREMMNHGAMTESRRDGARPIRLTADRRHPIDLSAILHPQRPQRYEVIL